MEGALKALTLLVAFVIIGALPFMVALLGFSRRSRPRSWRNTGQVSHTILARAARLRLFGKHAAGFYLRLNRRIWERLFPLTCGIPILSERTGRGCRAWFASSKRAGNILER